MRPSLSGPSTVADALRISFAGVAKWLFACAHRKTAIPVTLPASVGEDGQVLTRAETYVVCLECGGMPFGLVHTNTTYSEPRTICGVPAKLWR